MKLQNKLINGAVGGSGNHACCELLLPPAQPPTSMPPMLAFPPLFTLQVSWFIGFLIPTIAFALAISVFVSGTRLYR